MHKVSEAPISGTSSIHWTLSKATVSAEALALINHAIRALEEKGSSASVFTIELTGLW